MFVLVSLILKNAIKLHPRRTATRARPFNDAERNRILNKALWHAQQPPRLLDGYGLIFWHYIHTHCLMLRHHPLNLL